MPNNLVYPDLYYQVYTKVMDVISRHIESLSMKENISDEYLEKMIDEVYIDLVNQYPEIDEDPIERRNRRGRFSKNRVAQRSYYGRKRLLRNLISIILISELLRRGSSYGYRNFSEDYYNFWY